MTGNRADDLGWLCVLRVVDLFHRRQNTFVAAGKGELGMMARIVCLLIGLLLVCAGCGSGTMSQSESDAREALRALGAMTVLDIDGVHVGTISLVSPTVQDKMEEAIPLVARTPYVTHLDLTGTNVTDQQMDQIAGLGKLHSLVLSQTGITDAGLKKLASRGLDTLYVNDTQLTSASTPVIAGMSKLKILEVSGDVASDLAPLSGLEKLEWLVLDDVTIDEDDVDVLAGMSSLGRLSLNDCTISEAAMGKLRSARPQLAIDVKSGGVPVTETEAAESTEATEAAE